MASRQLFQRRIPVFVRAHVNSLLYRGHQQLLPLRQPTAIAATGDPWEMNATAIHSERAMVVLPWDQCCQPLLASTCPRPFVPESQISTTRPLYAHPCFRPWLCGHSACACVSGIVDKAATGYPASLIPEPLSLHTCPCSKP